ncbi:uncharacterized protein LOC119191269 [Manduca sexta]|uniref:MADF domain-containing protein n=1 Tax=Manduca sexta TaxID=7130 RepID=A0A921Z923_MANSE|nr:uncharacterized protein LOC115445505 [Manduca sexta]XP_037301072.1 uncharacterized protein LOC119191269 [Manduca sexta]KAG6453240.1 hypothetical protein O3G_MSEX008054 [Manduca sexta]
MSFEEIIMHVKNTPVIWQTSHPNFKKRNVLSRTWAEMAKTLDVDESFLKKRWKHLKDQYRKELKKVLASSELNPEEVEVTWQYYNDLSFLRHELFTRGTRKKNTEVPVVSEGSDTEHDSDSEASASKMRKYDDTKNVSMGETFTAQDRMDVSWQNDADYMFLMSILPSMKNLTEIQKLQFRGKVNDWLIEAYTQNGYAGNEYVANDTDNKMYLHSQLVKRRNARGHSSLDPLNSE